MPDILEDVSSQIRESIKARQEPVAIDLMGGISGDAALAARTSATEEGAVSLTGRAMSSTNAAVGVKDWAQRKLIPNDPNFKIEDYWDEIKVGVPQEYWSKFSDTQSIEEARMLKSDLLQEMQDRQVLSMAGFRGFAAMAVAGIVDVDAPLMLLSGGTYLGTKTAAGLSKLGIEGTRTARAISTGAAGVEAGVLTETANVFARPTGEWTDIPAAGLGGLVFGTGLGTMGGTTAKANKAAAALREEFTTSKADGSAGRMDYTTSPTDDGLFTLGNSSVGAAQSGRAVDDTLNTGANELLDKAHQFLIDNDIVNQIETAFPDTVAGRAAKRFYDALSSSPLATDWDALHKSKSVIAQSLAYKMFESPAGIVRNNKSSAIMNGIYTNQIAAPVNTNYGKMFDEWVVSQGIDKHKVAARVDNQLLDRFNQELYIELQYRYHDGTSNPNSNPAIIKMADKIDMGSENALNIMRGRGGETAVKGAENLKPEKGWFPQRWRGDKISAMIAGGVSRTTIETALAKSYMKMYPNWDMDMATKFAKAVTRRSLAKERGIDTNVARMLDQEGQDFMEDFLRDNGFSKESAEKLIAGLRGLKADQNKIGILKERKDVDLREAIPGTNYKLMDLVDTDVVRVWTTYSRQSAGASALARQGIQKADKKQLIDAILAEQDMNGGNTLSRAQLEAMFSYFDGGAFAGGVDSWLRRALQATNLSLLNSLGLTQGAEAGVQIAAVGWDSFRKTAPKEVKDLLAGKNTPAMEELRAWTAAIDGEHMVYMDHLALDEMRKDPGQFAEAGQFLDKMLVRGSRAQGYLSGFYKMKQLQQRIAVRSMMHRLGAMYNADKAMSSARLADLGLGGGVAERIGNYFKNGVVEFAEDGDVMKLNFDKWRPEDITEFAAALNRHADQVVQKAMRGESSVWMHKDVGAVLTHLKSFTILAMQKQLVRNMRIMDTEATMAFVYGMATAGVVYTAGQALRGNTENLSPEKVMKGAFMLNNMTGWIPQWSDPVASMLGMDDLRFSHYGAQGVGGDVIGVPPVLTQMNRMAHIPSSAVKVATGQYKNEDIYALQATPIIGNLYGFSYMFNSMKD